MHVHVHVRTYGNHIHICVSSCMYVCMCVVCTSACMHLVRTTARSVLDDAKVFMRMYREECGMNETAYESRLCEIRTQIERTGSYLLSAEELAYGVKVWSVVVVEACCEVMIQ